jgi:2-haloacid dehalogenase
MNTSITAIIFDFGNVLVKWDIHALYKRFFPDPQAVDSFLREINFPEWNARQDAGRPFKEGVKVLCTQFPQYAELIQAYDTDWDKSVTGTIDGTVNIVRSLKEAGWPLYILSNFSAEKFPLMQQRYGFLQLFDDMIISGEHRMIKPDPAIFELTLNRIKRTASECLFIDDSLTNIETAHRLGFHTIHFQSPQQLEMSLKQSLPRYRKKVSIME